MRKLGLIILAFCLQGVVTAQTGVRFSQLNFLQGVNNPAALSIDGSIMVDMVARNQWMGIDGAPTTLGLNAQYEILNDMAVGLNVFHDRIGVHQTTAVSGQYAYRLFFDNNVNALAFGVAAGIDNKISDYASTQTTIANDPAFASSFSRVKFNASVGVYYYSPTFYVGLSIPQMFQNDFSTSDNNSVFSGFHYYLSTGFYISLGENYTLNPHIQVKAVQNAPIAGDLILRNTFMNRFSIVAGFRSEQSIIVGADFLITPMFRAGYSFNYDVGSLSRIKGVSNEIYLGIAFPYRSDRSDFGKRIYINKKGGFRSDYRRKAGIRRR